VKPKRTELSNFLSKKLRKSAFKKRSLRSTSEMHERVAATEQEVEEAINALTDEDLVNLLRSAEFRMWTLGRASKGKTGPDLLQEAFLSTLAGSNGGRGRRWYKDVSFKVHLLGAMRSIASHLREQFDEQEVHLESQFPSRVNGNKEPLLLDNIASTARPADVSMESKQKLNMILEQFRNDRDACRVLEGWRVGMKGPEIIEQSGMSEKQFGAAVKRIRNHPLLLKLRSNKPQRGRRQGEN
jgi:hypothetical protein